MADNIQFYVDDTSPSISYFPFGDTFSVPNLTAGWNPYYDESGFASALGETGKGITYHVTSCDGASIIVQWNGTGIQLFGQPTQATYTITLDGTPAQSFSVDLENNVLAIFTNLADTSHTIVLTTQIFQNQSEFFFDKALIIGSRGAVANTSITQRALNDNDIAYSGQWSFQNVSGSSFHHSATIGDRANAHFRGILFLLNGTTSPTSGDYTVVLDNVATSFSAKSSFTTLDALLFYAGDLDPNVTHTVQVINDGGDLSLDVGGFTVFLTEPAISETPSSTPSPLATPPGTIAALVLAGVLLFLILTALLFWVFVVRPRRRHHRHVGPEQSKKEAEAGLVIDIGPEMGPSVESRRDEINPPQRDSEKSGFARWKRDMEGGLGSLIGITFRHSGSPRGKVTSRHVVDEVKSSLFSLSSKSSLRRSKGKAKKGSKGRQSATIGVPARPSSIDSSKDKDINLYQDPPEGPHSVVSTLTSLSYASSPSPLQNPQPAPPPSYSVSNSNGNSHSTSEPHSASHSFPSATHHDSGGGRRSSRTRDEPALGSGDDVLPHDRHDPLSRVPDAHLPSRVTSGDQDSTQNSSDGASSLQAAVTQFALRGLSPRTSKYVDPTLVKPKPVGDRPLIIEPRVRPRPLPDPPQSRADRPDPQDSPKSLEESRQTATRPFDDSLLNPIPNSPFRVDFSTTRPLKPNRESGPPVSFVRFDENSREELTMAGGESDASKRGAEQSQDPQAKRRSIFRLTPPSGPSQIVSARRPRADSTSFLDLTSSSDSSTRTQSLMTPDEQESSRQWATLPLPRLQTRWSTSATDLSINASLGAPRSAFSGHFPYPVSVATSPEGHIPSESIAISTPQIPQHVHAATDSPMIHPFFPSSPADSVPISVSEIQFRRSSTSSHSTNSPLPPHPPLPGRETGLESGDLVTPALSTPNLIVQRVLGQPTTTPPTG